jgi:hypothetical protein
LVSCLELFQLYLLDKISSKKSTCGSKSREFVSPSGESRFYPVYCDNRSCSNPACKEHRGYKYSKSHRGQVLALMTSVKSPKSWVFTGWVLPLSELSREFIQSKMLYLVRLLRQFSNTEFSVHMEVKIQSENTAYLHFHVVSGSIENLGLVRRLWGRQIKYESALTESGLVSYISKYASKCPTYYCQSDEDYYSLLVYKTQMHRFSPHVAKCESSTYWYDMESLVRDMTSALWSTRANHGIVANEHVKQIYWRSSDFVPYLDKPPNPDGDVPACVYVYPAIVKSRYRSSRYSKNRCLEV